MIRGVLGSGELVMGRILVDWVENYEELGAEWGVIASLVLTGGWCLDYISVRNAERRG